MSSQPDNTDTAATRWTYTNDLLAFFVVLSFVGYVFAPFIPGGQVPETHGLILTGFVAGFGIVIAWAFGPEAVQAWRDYQDSGE